MCKIFTYLPVFEVRSLESPKAEIEVPSALHSYLESSLSGSSTRLSQLVGGIWVLVLIEGNGTPLQYSCLENPMDGGAW